MDKLSYFYIFLQSNLIEVFVYYYFYRSQKSFSPTLALTTFSNTLTHPIVFFVIMASKLNYLSAILVAEAFAVIAETFLHAYFGKLPLKTAAKAALVSNLVSWQIAPVLTYYLFF